jgi:hypothetical protein
MVRELELEIMAQSSTINACARAVSIFPALDRGNRLAQHIV